LVAGYILGRYTNVQRKLVTDNCHKQEAIVVITGWLLIALERGTLSADGDY